MPIHKQIHIRLTSSFDKWLQMASVQGEFLSLQSEKIDFKFSFICILFLFFPKQLAFIQKNESVQILEKIVSLVRVPRFRCIVSIWCFFFFFGCLFFWLTHRYPAVLSTDLHLTPTAVTIKETSYTATRTPNKSVD